MREREAGDMAVPPRATTAARRAFRAGTVGGVAVATILWAAVDVPWADAMLLGALLAFLPMFAVGQAVLLGLDLPSRLSMYLSSGVSILLLGALSLGVGWGSPGPTAMGLGGGVGLGVIGVALALTAAAVALLFAVRAGESRLGWSETPLLLELLPRTRAEKTLFGGLSFVAGFGEEIAYRGFALAWVSSILGSPSAAVIVTSLAFGLLHAYQGVAGVVRTGLLGGLFGISVVTTGSLWPAILAHTAVDLLAGLVLADTLTGVRDGHRSGSVG
jgi:membrane protease YdiL (CAAX protease family)